MMKKILIVVGTRPNFIKVTQFKKVNADLGMPFDIKIVHTGQHYDSKMADIFFEQFDLTPDFWLNIPSGSPNSQMAEIMLRLEKVIQENKPDLLMVVGDVNSTFAAALTANKMDLKIAHVESGLRSFDRTMPEEINRLLTDEITDYFFITEDSGYKNLLKEGKQEKQMFFVGNTMIDTLVAFDKKIQQSNILETLKIKSKEFVLMTMHRPATVDHKDGLKQLFSIIELITKNHQLVFPIHPRTLHRIEEFGMKSLIAENRKLILTEPLDYLAFQKLISDCAYIVTDSGGIQEESTFRQIPCLTLRANTERPCTVDIGTNELVPFSQEKISDRIDAIVQNKYKKGIIPPLWDGQSTKRILEACMIFLSSESHVSTLLK